MVLQPSFSSASSSSSSFGDGFSYDVFLSFRGPDTRYGFTGYLYKALCDRGINTFIDDEELQRGEEITPSLVKAIEESRIAIPVFSTNYASSSFCLVELAKIIECFKANGRLVLPVFYHVNPSHVRCQRGSYGEAMAKHEERFKDDMEKVNKWREALTQVPDLSGFHFTHRDGYEHEFIEKIVKRVSREIKHVVLPVAEYLVGMESRVSKVISLLDVESNDGVHVIGIHGIGGIGKTTLAWAVYKQIANHFEGTCFLEHVRENSIKHGLEHLRCSTLSKLLGEKKIKLLGVQQGISMIQHRLSRKKVLLILDDVDKREQLQAIVGKLNWFGPSSRIIITTRDKHLLEWYGVEKTYESEGLDEAQALELLSWKAFKTIVNVNPIYRGVLSRVVTYACGLPLALKVLGPSLFGKSVKEWESALDRYEKIPSDKIHDILKVSFDALEKDELSVFLDIACCFEEFTLPEIEDILHGHYGDCMTYHLRVLVEKSLIKIDGWDDIELVILHDLIRDMGKEIVRQESLKRPGKPSRLWFHEDIVQVLEDNQGTGEIEIIHLDIPFDPFDKYKQEIEWDGNALKKMKNLKTLVIRNGHFSEGPKHLPKSLRVLEWWKFPSRSLPCDFHPRKLSMLKLPQNCLTSAELAVLFKKFVNLKVLDLRSSECLIEIPDVSGLPNLEKLLFDGCGNLTTIHSSVGFLDKLRILSVEDCVKLRTFPPIKLTSLEELRLSGCRSLENFPDVIGKMENITEICLKGTLINELPFSFRNLTQLQRLYVLNARISFRMQSSLLVMMPELVEIIAERLDGWLSPKPEEGEETVSSTVSSNVARLYLTRCKLSDDFFATGLKWFANVKELCLDDSNLRVISACIKECRFLRKLTVDDCQHLQEIRGVPPNLEQFSARHCKSLTSSCTSMLLSQELHEAGNTSFIVPAERIPEWLEQRSRGPSISFWFRNKFPALALWVVAGPSEPNMFPLTLWYRPSVIINGKKRFIDSGEEQDCCTFRMNSISSFVRMDHIFLCDLQKIKFQDNLDEALLENEWNHAELSYTIANGPDNFPKECGVHAFKQKSNMEGIQFTDPYKRRKLDDGLSSPES